MISTQKNLLGVGLYTPAEAALYARVSTQLLSRWMFGSQVGSRVIDPQLGDTDERLITFLDFVQAMAIRSIRRTHPRVTLQRIRQAVDRAKQHYGIDFPFAMQHKTFVFYREEAGKPAAKEGETDPACEIVFRDDAKRLTQLTGSHAGNRMLGEVVELYLSDLTFDEHGLAIQYVPMTKGDLKIVLDPKKRFGEPLIPSCGYTAKQLADATKSEGSIEAAAIAYGVEPKEVELACSYFDYLQGPTPA